MLTAGCIIEYDPAMVSIVSIEAYDDIDLPGPWDGAGTNIFIEESLGAIMVFLQLSCVNPDSGGDIILGKGDFPVSST